MHVFSGRLSIVFLLALAGLGCSGGGFEVARVEEDTGKVGSSEDSGDALEDAILEGGDVAKLDSAPDSADAVDTRPSQICKMPVGASASSSSSGSMHPEFAVDSDKITYWQVPAYEGSIKITFPAPLRIDRVHLAAKASPSTFETYKITGYLAGKPGTVTTVKRFVDTEFSSWSAPIEIPIGIYDSVVIDVSESMSWVTVAEVDVYDSSCGI